MVLNGIALFIWAIVTIAVGVFSYASGKSDGRDEAYDEVDRELRKRKAYGGAR